MQQQMGIRLPLNGAKFLIEITPELTVEDFVARVRQRLNAEVDNWSLNAAAEMLERLKSLDSPTTYTGHGIYFGSSNKEL